MILTGRVIVRLMHGVCDRENGFMGEPISCNPFLARKLGI